jgi:hypothetical protein
MCLPWWLVLLMHMTRNRWWVFGSMSNAMCGHVLGSRRSAANSSTNVVSSNVAPFVFLTADHVLPTHVFRPGRPECRTVCGLRGRPLMMRPTGLR